MAKIVRKQKQLMRRIIRAKLQAVNPNELKRQSLLASQRLCDLPAFKESRGVCVFLSMDHEFDTSAILRKVFATNKKCFVPRVIDGTEMEMLEAYSFEDIQSFPRNHWDIPEPPASENRTEARTCDEVDFIVMPGLAFDTKCQRLGQGKGYYDRYLTQMRDARRSRGLSMVPTVAPALSCQMVDSVPTNDLDVVLTAVVFATRSPDTHASSPDPSSASPPTTAASSAPPANPKTSITTMVLISDATSGVFPGPTSSVAASESLSPESSPEAKKGSIE